MIMGLFKTNCIWGAGGHVIGIFLMDLFHVLSFRAALYSCFFLIFLCLPAFLSAFHNLSRIYFFPPAMHRKFDSER